MQVPLTRPWLGDEEAMAVADVLATGMLVSGEQVTRFEALVADRCARAHAIAVSSGTSALELAMHALGVGPGDEVIVPDLTWPSPAHAARTRGATIVPIDVHPTEINAAPAAFAAARTERTRLAVVIDQFGFPARHAEVRDALGGLPILADAACALGSTLDGAPCGSHGVVASLSLHPRKVITTGEGGVLLTDDAELATRLRALRNHGQVGPGKFAEPAGNHRMTEIAAAVGIVQLGRLDEIVRRRHARAARYYEALGELPLVAAIEGAEPNYQTLGLCVPDGFDRDRVLSELRAAGVGAGLLSYSLHRLQSVGYRGRPLPESARLSARGIALPLFPTMTDEQQELVIGTVRGMLVRR